MVRQPAPGYRGKNLIEAWFGWKRVARASARLKIRGAKRQFRSCRTRIILVDAGALYGHPGSDGWSGSLAPVTAAKISSKHGSAWKRGGASTPAGRRSRGAKRPGFFLADAGELYAKSGFVEPETDATVR
jgi:hypothetical protein